MYYKILMEFIFPIISVFIPVFVTVYTVNNRIKNDNRESHKPYIVLNKIEALKTLDIDSYYLTIIGRNYDDEKLDIEKLKEKVNNNDLSVALKLENIGYGVATNIKFYNLLTGNKIIGTQATNKAKDQKLFTTFDIASNEEKTVQTRIISMIKEAEGINKDDHNRILCIYKDLNNNYYNLIISINIKANGHYDFFAYQPSSKSYRRWIRENKKEYKNIINEYLNF